MVADAILDSNSTNTHKLKSSIIYGKVVNIKLQHLCINIRFKDQVHHIYNTFKSLC
jgi:hypothetical protein